MQTILGANGIISTEIAKALPAFTSSIRLVSRHPKKVNPTDEIVSADLLNATQTAEAVKGSAIVYLAAGLPYNSKVWQQQWPVVMKNVIDACIEHRAKLVFFDNTYMYGQVNGVMTEDTPYNAQSKKGMVRATIARMLLDTMKDGSLTGMICRAPEFYGPRNTLSGVNTMVFDNIRKGKKSQWLINDKVQRTYIYTPDAGKATALLGNTPAAYGQVWHLPCTDEYMNGKNFIALTSEIYGKPLKYTVLNTFMVKMAGLFIPYVKETVELLYQYEQDYQFSSNKFKKQFPDFPVTNYRQGITEIIEEIKNN